MQVGKLFRVVISAYSERKAVELVQVSFVPPGDDDDAGLVNVMSVEGKMANGDVFLCLGQKRLNWESHYLYLLFYEKVWSTNETVENLAKLRCTFEEIV